jgi:hypothetical protein
MDNFPLRPTSGRLRVPDVATGTEAVEDEQAPGRFRAGASIVVMPDEYELRGFGSLPVTINETLRAGIQVWLINVENRLVLVPSSAGDLTT